MKSIDSVFSDNYTSLDTKFDRINKAVELRKPEQAYGCIVHYVRSMFYTLMSYDWNDLINILMRDKYEYVSPGNGKRMSKHEFVQELYASLMETKEFQYNSKKLINTLRSKGMPDYEAEHVVHTALEKAFYEGIPIRFKYEYVEIGTTYHKPAGVSLEILPGLKIKFDFE